MLFVFGTAPRALLYGVTPLFLTFVTKACFCVTLLSQLKHCQRAQRTSLWALSQLFYISTPTPGKPGHYTMIIIWKCDEHLLRQRITKYHFSNDYFSILWQFSKWTININHQVFTMPQTTSKRKENTNALCEILWNDAILNSFHLFDNRKVFEKGEQAEVWESLVVPGENTILFETDSVLQSPD